MILPRPDASFEWRRTASGPSLVCPSLEALAPHLFTTRFWRLGAGDRSDLAWSQVASALAVDPEMLQRLHQVHGRAVVRADEASDFAAPPAADVVVAGNSERAIAVQAADCVPVLIADRRRQVVGAAHAGWRGLALGVPRIAVQALADAYGSRPDDLVAAIGPSVGACCYEVGPDVRDAFLAEGHGRVDVARWFRSEPDVEPNNPPMPGLPPEPRPGHEYFDGWACARSQLLQAGIPDAQIFSARLCTASHSDVFCSYRRERAAAGRMAGAIRAKRG
jgi:YfiH family protein